MGKRMYRLPLEIVELDSMSYHIMVEGMINGLPCHLIIDTGASRTVFDRNYFGEELEILTVTTEDLHTAGIMAGNIETVFARAKYFSLEGFTLENLQIVLIDLTAINDIYRSVTGKNIHGLLGSDFLVRHKAVIDFKNSILTLRL